MLYSIPTDAFPFLKQIIKFKFGKRIEIGTVKNITPFCCLRLEKTHPSPNPLLTKHSENANALPPSFPVFLLSVWRGDFNDGKKRADLYS